MRTTLLPGKRNCINNYQNENLIVHIFFVIKQHLKLITRVCYKENVIIRCNFYKIQWNCMALQKFLSNVNFIHSSFFIEREKSKISRRTARSLNDLS